MQIDCDFYIRQIKREAPGLPVIRMFGVTRRGNSVLVHIYNFFPYFYVEVPDNFVASPANLESLCEQLQREGEKLKNVGT